MSVTLFDLCEPGLDASDVLRQLAQSFEEVDAADLRQLLSGEPEVVERVVERGSELGIGHGFSFGLVNLTVYEGLRHRGRPGRVVAA